MNERAWLTSTDPKRMLRLAAGTVSLCCGCVWCDNGDGTMSLADGQHACPQCDNARPRRGYRAVAGPRKLRLFACACCRLTQSMHYPEAEAAVAAAEAAAADGILTRASARKLAAARKSLDAVGGWFWCVTEQNVRAGLWQTLAEERTGYGNGGGLYTEQMAALLREVVGNPYDRLEVAAEFRTDLVVTMARTIYADRAWGDLPILADALQDAGYPDAAEGPCRGCGGLGVVVDNDGTGTAHACVVCSPGGNWAGSGLRQGPSRLLAHLRGQERAPDCGVPAHDLECAGCEVRLYRRNVADVCRLPQGPHVTGCQALDVLLGNS